MAWHMLCDLSELTEAVGREFVVEGTIIAVFREGQQIHALDGMCAHQGGPIAQGKLDGKCVTCPWHGWQYNISNGKNILTGKKMLDSFPTELRDGKIWIEIA